MAKAVAVRRIVNHPDGSVYVEFTYGTPPLQAAPTTGMTFSSSEELKQRIVQVEEVIGEGGLAMLHLAITYLQSNGTFRNENQVTNKTVTLDPLAAAPLRVT